MLHPETHAVAEPTVVQSAPVRLRGGPFCGDSAQAHPFEIEFWIPAALGGRSHLYRRGSDGLVFEHAKIHDAPREAV